MAEGFLRHLARDRYEVFSAGTRPTQVRAEAIIVMGESGIDISGHRSKSIDQFLGQQFDFVIMVCDNAKQICPVFPAEVRRIHWSFEDPATEEGPESERLSAFRRVRDQIRERIESFATTPEMT